MIPDASCHEDFVKIYLIALLRTDGDRFHKTVPLRMPSKGVSFFAGFVFGF